MSTVCKTNAIHGLAKGFCGNSSMRVRGMVRGFAVKNLIHNRGAEGSSYPTLIVAQQTFDCVHTDQCSDTMRTQLGRQAIQIFQLD